MRILKEFIRITMITQYILHLRVNLIVGKLLALAPVVKKQLIKTITKDNVFQIWVNTLGLAKLFK